MDKRRNFYIYLNLSLRGIEGNNLHRREKNPFQRKSNNILKDFEARILAESIFAFKEDAISKINKTLHTYVQK